MNNKPLTFRQAADTLQNYSDLKGQTIIVDNQPYTIEWVTIAPYSEDEQSSFAEKVYYLEDWQLALHTYTGNTYDVLLIAVHQNIKLNFTWLNIDAYQKMNNRFAKNAVEMTTAA